MLGRSVLCAGPRAGKKQKGTSLGKFVCARARRWLEGERTSLFVDIPPRAAPRRRGRRAAPKATAPARSAVAASNSAAGAATSAGPAASGAGAAVDEMVVDDGDGDGTEGEMISAAERQSRQVTAISLAREGRGCIRRPLAP